MFIDPARIDPALVSRSATFENPTGAKGAGGSAAGGRKGSPSRELEAGERVVLLDAEGPGTIRHIWMTFEPAAPEIMRAQWIEVFYDGASEPSVSVPCLDFFGLPHGRPVPYASALASAQEGRGFNFYAPMPFAQSIRIEYVNGADVPRHLYYQVDYTLGAVEPSYLHVSFRRQNPTTQRRDFTIAEGLRGPGRFLGCVVGIRTVDPGTWYGEGEVKVYLDGDDELPTICGTGLEDYVGTAWGMGPHAAPFAGAPVEVLTEGAFMPDFLGFYRWHVPDPIMFERDLRVDLQQIGAAWFSSQEELERFSERQPLAGGEGMLVIDDHRDGAAPGAKLYGGLHERVDDVCAAAFVYCRTPQPVPRLDLAAALADLDQLPHEQVAVAETMFFVMPDA